MLAHLKMGFIQFRDMNFLRDEENHLFFIDEQAAVQGVDLGSCFETAKTRTIYEIRRRRR